MRTFEDFEKVKSGGEADITKFILQAISEHKASKLYTEAYTAYEYFKKRNVTISQYQKLLYTMSGQAVPDNFSANYKFTNAFFPIFVKQENLHLLGNGVTFGNEQTKEKLGGDTFDDALIRAGEYSLWGAVSFGFFNLDHVEVFKVLEFVPLFGEEDGALHAGIRWWQIDDEHPMRVTLYEEDGYTDYVYRKGNGERMQEKRTYKQVVQTSVVDGTQIFNGSNYPSFPIVPLWGNEEHQTELTGLREKIDGYDLIQSGFANDLDDASQIYWTITNAGGMDDVDLAKFIERMKVVRAAVVDEQGSTAQAHTIDVPFAARQAGLADLRDSLYRDAMALDTDKISAGNVTATAIEASYENLTLKCNGYESCVTTFIQGLLALIGVEDSPIYKRSKIVNMQEDTNMVLAAAQYLDEETVLAHLPFLSPDEIDEILIRKDKEEAERYAEMERRLEELQNEKTENEEDESGQSTEEDGQNPVEDGEKH